jgi:hypothetical protein
MRTDRHNEANSRYAQYCEKRLTRNSDNFEIMKCEILWLKFGKYSQLSTLLSVSRSFADESLAVRLLTPLRSVEKEVITFTESHVCKVKINLQRKFSQYSFKEDRYQYWTWWRAKQVGNLPNCLTSGLSFMLRVQWVDTSRSRKPTPLTYFVVIHGPSDKRSDSIRSLLACKLRTRGRWIYRNIMHKYLRTAKQWLNQGLPCSYTTPKCTVVVGGLPLLSSSSSSNSDL